MSFSSLLGGCLILLCLQQVPGCPLDHISLRDPYGRGDATTPSAVDAAGGDATDAAADRPPGGPELLILRRTSVPSRILVDGPWWPVDTYCLQLSRSAGENAQLFAIGIQLYGPTVATSAVGIHSSSDPTEVPHVTLTEEVARGTVTLNLDGNYHPIDLEAGWSECFDLVVKPAVLLARNGNPLLVPRSGSTVGYGIRGIRTGESEGPEWAGYTGFLLLDVRGVTSGRQYRVGGTGTRSEPFVIRNTSLQATVLEHEDGSRTPLAAIPIGNFNETLFLWSLSAHAHSDASLKQVGLAINIHRESASRLTLGNLRIDGAPGCTLVDLRAGMTLGDRSLGNPSIREEGMTVGVLCSPEQRITEAPTLFRLVATLAGGVSGDRITTGFWQPGDRIVTGASEIVSPPLDWGEHRAGAFVIADATRDPRDLARFDPGTLIWADRPPSETPTEYTNGLWIPRLGPEIPRTF